jgi:hypothetical protein
LIERLKKKTKVEVEVLFFFFVSQTKKGMGERAECNSKGERGKNKEERKNALRRKSTLTHTPDHTK